MLAADMRNSVFYAFLTRWERVLSGRGPTLTQRSTDPTYPRWQ
jgi:hypothetical protein